MTDDLSELYQQVIMDHSKRPRNFRVMEAPTCSSQGFNPLCGDNITLFLKTEGDVVKDVSFQGSGCAISVASASVMTESLKGKSKAEAEALFHNFHGVITEGKADFDNMGKLAAFVGVSRYPTRVKCAMLSWHAAKSALEGGEKVISTES